MHILIYSMAKPLSLNILTASLPSLSFLLSKLHILHLKDVQHLYPEPLFSLGFGGC